MKTTVVTGLLGSGKTTFIRNRLQGVNEKTVVLVNDFAAAGIDGEIFSADGIESVELPSGCVCCTLKFDLITTIKKIMQEFKPEHLVIEPSGVASPTGVLEALESAGIRLYTVIGIVDVTEFAELYESGMYGSFFRDQVALSDIILVNKIDLADEGKIRDAEKLIESINPRALLFRTKNAKLTQLLSPLDRLIPVRNPFPLRRKDGMRVGLPGRDSVGMGLPRDETILFTSTKHLHFETLSFHLKENTSLAQFSNFFAALAEGQYGNVAWAKALINSDAGSYRFDSVYGKIDKVPFEQVIKEGRLVVIGQELDRNRIQAELAEKG